MSDEQQQQRQADIAAQLAGSLESLQETAFRTIQTQSELINSYAPTVIEFSGHINTINEYFNTSAEFLERIETSSNRILNTMTENIKRLNTITEEQQKGLESSLEVLHSTTQTSAQLSNEFLEERILLDKKMELLYKRHAKEIKKGKISQEKLEELLGELDKEIEQASAESENLNETVNSLSESNDGLKKLIDGSRTFFTILSSAVGAFTQLFKLTLTLPLTILDFGKKIGDELRKQLVEGLGQTLENAKEKFDLSSSIGNTIKKIGNSSKAMLLDFQSPSSMVSRLYGMGAEGLSKRTQEFVEIMEAVGTYSEVIHAQFNRNSKDYEYFILLKRALGLNNEDLKYYAISATNSMMPLSKRVEKAKDAFFAVADKYGINRKALAKYTQVLRNDILNFSQLSDVELGEAAAYMTRFGLKAEDAAAVMNKFSTFEETANSVAILSQTFGMNLNTLDLINAKNPKEIFEQLRSAMLDTGISFKELGRIEKQIIAQQMGISEQAMMSLLNYTDAGMSFEQARKKIEDNKPEQKQIRALRELRSAVKELKKVMQFDSVFEAIGKGLLTQGSLQGETREVLMLLSGSYEDLYEKARTISPGIIQPILEPIVYIIREMKALFSDPRTLKSIQVILKGFGKFLETNFLSESDQMILHLEDTLKQKQKAEEKNKKQNDDKSDVKSIIHKLKEKINSEEVKFSDLSKIYKKAEEENKTKEFKTFEQFLQVFIDGTSDLEKKAKDNVLSQLKELIGFNNEIGNTTENLTTSLREANDLNSDNVSKYRELSKMLSRIMVIGGLSGLTALIRLLNEQLNKTDLQKVDSIFAEHFNIDQNEWKTLKENFLNALTGLFAVEGVFSGVVPSIMGQIVSVFYEIASIFGQIIKSVFTKIFSDDNEALKSANNKTLEYNVMSDNTYVAKDILQGKKELPQPVQENVSKSIFGSYDDGVQGDLFGDPDYGKQQQNMYKETFMYMMHDLEKNIFPDLDRNKENIKDYNNVTKFLEVTNTAKKSFENEKLNFNDFNFIRSNYINYRNFNNSLKRNNSYKKADDLSSVLSSLVAAPFTMLGKDDRPIDLSTAGGFHNKNVGLLSSIFNRTNNITGVAEDTTAIVDDKFSSNTSNLDNSVVDQKSQVSIILEDLHNYIVEAIDKSKDKKVKVSPEIDNDVIYKMMKSFIGNNFVQMMMDNRYLQGVVGLNASAVNSPTFNTPDYSGATNQYKQDGEIV